MDELSKYKVRLKARISQLVDRINEGTATKEFVAFEVFYSLFDAFERGVGHEELSDAYPVKAWREDTVVVPRAIARVFFEGWEKYRESDSSVTMGNAFHMEGGQGKSPITKTNNTIDRDLGRSNAVLIEKLLAEKEGKKIKLDAVFFQIAADETARTGKKVKPDTIKKAYLKYGADTERKYRKKHR